MFTGIVEDIGVIEAIVNKDYVLSMTIESLKLFDKPSLGGSISINGVCLTQSAWEKGLSTFDVVNETLQKTNLGLLVEGDEVNIERAMEVGARIEGHFVQGHIDGLGLVQKIDRERDEIWIEIPDSMQNYLVEKGSIALNGVSLTIAHIEGSKIKVALIPHTLKKTIFGSIQPGDPVNLEIDIFAKYACKYLENIACQKNEVL
ncbi:MAG: Riboflavin synthase [Chlamydiae bacterium]|nr:Riboflavin synthase [Chlamydiota bacterium]